MGIWSVYAGLSDWFFCHIDVEEVVISLKKTQWFYKCKDTVSSLDSLILQNAKDVMTIQTYINRGYDVDYRTNVRYQKLTLLKKYQTTKKQIIENMQTFESNLIKKSIYYFVLSVTPYKVSLQRSLVKLDAMTGSVSSRVVTYAAFLKEQVATIEALSVVETIDELVPLLNKFIYLKKEISWRSE